MFPRIHGVVSQGGGGGGAPPTPQYGIATYPGSPATFGSPAQRGYTFTPGANINVIGARVRLWQSGIETVRLWRVTGAVLLDSISISAVSGTWVEGMFSSPIALTSGQNYIITTRRGNTSRTTEHNTAGDYTMHPLITRVNSISHETDSFPSTTHSFIVGAADIIFTT